MSIIYSIVLFGVGLIVVAGVLEAVIAVSRKPNWQAPSLAQRFAVVTTAERRAMQLPYVGAERRNSETAIEPVEAEPLRKAA